MPRPAALLATHRAAIAGQSDQRSQSLGKLADALEHSPLFARRAVLTTAATLSLERQCAIAPIVHCTSTGDRGAR